MNVAPALAQQTAPVENSAPTVAPAGESTAPAAPNTNSAQGTTPSPAAQPAPATSAQPAPTEVAPAPGAPNAAEAPSIAKATLPHNLSPWGMFMSADWVVKGVMIGLAFASLVTWTVWLAKSLEIAGSKARLAKALRGITGARRLDDATQALGNGAGIGGVLVRAAAEELEMSRQDDGGYDAAGVKERVESRLMRIQAQAGRRLSRGTGVLATIGSTAPFVGLFGTVWGIMNSFIGISEAQTTNLAVVAPGIAEALLATAVGLIAAIPAVVIYNVFARSITGYRQGLADAAAGVQRLVSRDLDRVSPAHTPARPHVSAPAARPANGHKSPSVAL
ncbi:tonB-system energizer ExbB [Mesorhizobium sp. IRAMC:0171]|uniref:Biopolymer transport protein ExbB n=2 Tax=Mesorhizobium retamae TaxID=2912854 RepID=A0ABS9QFF6_9HYPH|nr:tonB-system energizer ExbB [Mesorhizobium sp. IRAMC:0171]MCG7506142.1 tonB-system energizer ExbB [Mesorhizobium sp. IRAMC:0171]